METAQYEGSMGDVPCAVYSGVSLVGEALPVHCVSYAEVEVFVQRVSARDKVQYRLPTEAEWEYAARAGTETIYAGTSDAASLCQYANVATPEAKERLGWLQSFEVFSCEDGYVTLAPVKSLRPNAWGLYDMTGNVREWVEDWYGPYPMQDAVDYVNRKPNSTALRVNRGDGWIGAPMTASVSQRNENYPDERFPDLGFRLARSP